MLHPSTKMLINKLSEMTRKQRVEWDEGENGQVVHDTEGYRVIVTAAPHSVLLTDVLGKEIESCTADEIAGELDEDGRSYTQFVAELYREASRHARGAERAIGAILQGLDLEEPSNAADSLEEHDAPSFELEPSESMEDLADESDPTDYGALPDVDDAVAFEGEPIEGETEMTRAVEAMAEVVNGNTAEPTDPWADPSPESALSTSGDIEQSATDMDYETPEVQIDAPVDVDAPIDASEDIDAPIDALVDVDAPMDAPVDVPSFEAAEDVSLDAPAPDFGADEAADVVEATDAAIPEQYAEPDTFEASPEADIAPEPEVATEPVASETQPEADLTPEPIAADPVDAPQPTPAPAEQSRVAPIGGSSFFGSSLGDISRYRTQQLASSIDNESTPAEAPDTPAPSVDPQPAMDAAPEAVPAPAPEAAPIESEPTEAVATEPQEEEPQQAPRRFSLSGLASGFGMGAASEVTPPAPEATTPDEPATPPKMIDGTVDLPDHIPELEADASPVLPSFDQPLSSPETETLEEPEKDWVVRDEPAAAAPEAEPEASDESALKKPKPFNPWN